MPKDLASRSVRFAQPALDDLENIEFWTLENFGLQAMERYQALVFQAARDIRDLPDRIGVSVAHEQMSHVFSYHLRYSTKRLPPAGKVAHPRHLLIFSIQNGHIEVARILHDSMDIQSQLSDEEDE